MLCDNVDAKCMHKFTQPHYPPAQPAAAGQPKMQFSIFCRPLSGWAVVTEPTPTVSYKTFLQSPRKVQFSTMLQVPIRLTVAEGNQIISQPLYTYRKTDEYNVPAESRMISRNILPPEVTLCGSSHIKSYSLICLNCVWIKFYLNNYSVFGKPSILSRHTVYKP
jgi:hypothetical protein